MSFLWVWEFYSWAVFPASSPDFSLSLFFGCAGSSLLRGLFSSWGDWGPLSVAVLGLLLAVASLVAEHGSRARGLQ